jgi:myo-inositol-1-phosphate synthase
MMQTELLKKDLKTVGEEISHELGAQMVKNYQVANPADVKAFYIGRDIMEQILAQPGCVGIKFYNAYNEEGKKTLVYVGVDESGKNLVEYKVVNPNGEFEAQKAIVADRTQGLDAEPWWTWLFS